MPVETAFRTLDPINVLIVLATVANDSCTTSRFSGVSSSILLMIMKSTITEPSYTDTTLISAAWIPREAAILSTNEVTPPFEKNSVTVNSSRTPSVIASLGLMVRGQSGVM